MTSNFILATQAATGFSEAEKYDKHRPSYPVEAVEKLLSHLNVSGVQNAKIVDLACGTGKFTEALAMRPEEYEVIGVEPHESMRETLIKKNLGNRLNVLDGEAGNIPVGEGWADALVAAQAFHWFANEESLRDIHRVLTPGGTFGMIWNAEDYNGMKDWEPTTKWEEKLKVIVNGLDDGLSRFRDGDWKKVFEDQQKTSPLQALKDTFMHQLPQFSLPLGEESVGWTVWLSEQAIWDRYSTLSHIANTRGSQREQIHRDVFDAFKGDDVERNEKGEIAVHGVTYLAWTSRV
ncbi:methyltransferase C25B8.09 [Phlyctema vagabunda]|uniref:Methyltransferase C25B8.09 n=1 Tax=Phlyctema vagabunda TaxID=108571 RepID=A0ABR4P1U5_9HELO